MDDDRSVVEGIVSLLESIGYTAVGFVSAQDFLESPQVRLTDCLILDVRMPGMGGLELQGRREYPNPIIFITANGGQEVSGSRARALLREPFSQESLLKALRSALGLSEGSTSGQGPF